MGLRVDDQLVKPFNPGIPCSRCTRSWRCSGFAVRFIPFRLGSPAPGGSRPFAGGRSFALLFIDIKQFRIYNKYYGYSAGDEVVKWLARIIQEVPTNWLPPMFSSPISKATFAVMLPPDFGKQVGERLLTGSTGSSFYREEDRERGGLVVEDRDGQMTTGGFMSLAIALWKAENGNSRTPWK